MQASTGVFVSAIAAGKGIRERVFIFGCCFLHIWRKFRHGSAATVNKSQRRQNLDRAEPWLFCKSPKFLFLLRVTATGTKGVISCHITLGFWGSVAPKSLESVVSSFANNYITDQISFTLSYVCQFLVMEEADIRLVNQGAREKTLKRVGTKLRVLALTTVKLSSKLSETLHCKLSLGATIMQDGCRGNIFKHIFLDALGRAFEGFSALFIYHSWSYRSNSLLYHIWSCYIPQLLHCKCLFCILDLHGKV